MTKCNKDINHLYLLLTSAPISRKVKQSDEKVNNDTHTKAARGKPTVLKFIHLHSLVRVPVSSQPISIHMLLLLELMNEEEKKKKYYVYMENWIDAYCALSIFSSTTDGSMRKGG